MSNTDTPIDAEIVGDTSEPTNLTTTEASTLVPTEADDILSPAQTAEIDEERRQSVGKGKTHELTPFETLSILSMYRTKKMTQWEIARAINCNQSAVSRIIAKYTDTTDLAQATLKAGANGMAERLVKEAGPKVLVQVLKGIKNKAGERVLDAEREFGAQGGPVQSPIYLGLKIVLPGETGKY